MEDYKQLKAFYREVKSEIFTDENLNELSRLIENPTEGKIIYLPYRNRKLGNTEEQEKPISLTKALCLLRKGLEVEFKPFAWNRMGQKTRGSGQNHSLLLLQTEESRRPVKIDNCDQFNNFALALLAGENPETEKSEAKNEELLPGIVNAAEEIWQQLKPESQEAENSETALDLEIKSGYQPYIESQNGIERISHHRAYDFLAKNQPVYFKPITWNPGDNRSDRQHVAELNNYEALYQRSLIPNEGKEATPVSETQEPFDLEQIYQIPHISAKRAGFVGEWALGLNQDSGRE